MNKSPVSLVCCCSQESISDLTVETPMSYGNHVKSSFKFTACNSGQAGLAVYSSFKTFIPHEKPALTKWREFLERKHLLPRQGQESSQSSTPETAAEKGVPRTWERTEAASLTSSSRRSTTTSCSPALMTVPWVVVVVGVVLSCCVAHTLVGDILTLPHLRKH